MATELAKAYVQIVPSAHGIQGNIRNILDDEATEAGISAGQNISSALGGFLKASAATVATTIVGISALSKAALDEYANFEQLVGGVETLFGTSGKTIVEYAASTGSTIEEVAEEYAMLREAQELVLNNASEAYKTAGLTANEYMETVTSFSAALIASLDGDTAKAAQVADQAIVDMADNANKMGSSMESIQNAYQGFAKQNYTMLDNLKLGYGGTQAEMERLLEDASKISGIEYDISSYSDIVEAIHVVQTEMGITGTTAEEAATTISGSLASMKAAWGNLLVGIADDNQDIGGLIDNLVNTIIGEFDGEGVLNQILPRITIIMNGIGQLIQGLAPLVANYLPVLVNTLLPPLVSAVESMIVSLAGTLPDILLTIIDLFPEFIDLCISALIELLPVLVEVGLEAVINITEGISESLPTLIPAIVEVVISIVNTFLENIPLLVTAALDLITGLAQGIIAAIPVLLAALPVIITNLVNGLLSGINQIIECGIVLLTSLVEALPEIINIIVAVLPEIISSIISALLDNLPLIIQAGITLLTALVNDLPTIIMAIIDAIPLIIQGILDCIVEFLPLIVEAGIDLFLALITELPSIIVTLASHMPEIVIGMVNAILNCIDKVKEAGGQLIIGLWNGIGDKLEWLWDQVKEFCDQLIEKIKEYLGIHSPSTITAEIGRNLIRGIPVGIDDEEDTALQSVSHFTKAIENEFMDTRAGYSKDLIYNMAVTKSGTNYESNDTILIRDLIQKIDMLLQYGLNIMWEDRQLARLIQTYE